MSRYVDIENVKLKGISVFDQNLDVLVSLSDVRKSLQMTPTADVVEVVRCKDCKYRPTSGLPHQSCPMWDNGNDFLGAYWKGNDDGFCNYGERRKDNEQVH